VESWSQAQFGVKAGLNISSVQNFTFTEDDKNKTGLNLGVLARLKLDNSFFIQPELAYSPKGFRFSDPSQGMFGELTLNYLSVPLLAGYRVSKKFAVMLGPEAGFLISTNSLFDGINRNNTSTYSRFELSLDLGATFNITKRWALDLRYSRSLNNLSGAVVGHPTLEFVGMSKGSNEVMQFDIVYFFKIH
jgi:opacity protein-like surface antigen